MIHQFLKGNRGSNPGFGELFQGFDNFSQSSRSIAVAGQERTANSRKAYFYNVATSIEEVLSTLELSVDLAYSGIVDLDAKTKYFHSLDIQENNVVIIVKYRVNKDVIQRDVHPIESIRDQLEKKEISEQDFFYRYGDSYVSKVSNGGIYCASYIFRSRSKAEQISLEAEIKASGLTMSGKVDGGFAGAIKEIERSVSVRVDFRQKLIGFSDFHGRLPSSASEISKFVADLSSYSGPLDAVINFETVGYEHVYPVLKSRKTWDFLNANKKFRLENMSIYRLRLEVLIKEMEYIKSIYIIYSYDKDDVLNERLKDSHEFKLKWDAALDSVAENPFQDPTALAKEIDRSKLWGDQLPVLSYSVRDHFLCGMHGGHAFSDVNSAIDVLRGKHISQIEAHYGLYIDKISTTYKSMDGDSQLCAHGGTGGNRVPVPVSVPPGSRIDAITGFSGWYVDTLNITVNGVVTTLGRPHSDPNFEWNYKDDVGEIVIGFYGRSAWYLDQLGLILLRLDDAKWIENRDTLKADPIPIQGPDL